MSSASAHKQNREMNIAMGYSSPPDEAEKKYGNAMPKKRRDFLCIIEVLNKIVSKVGYSFPIWDIPKHLSAIHYVTVAKIFKVALRDNDQLGQGKCPLCKTMVEPKCTCPTCNAPVEIYIPNEKLEKNSCGMLETLLDRMAPKLQTATTQINVQNTIVNLTGGLAQIITEFVPPEKRMDCGIKIRSLIASYQNAIGTEVTSG